MLGYLSVALLAAAASTAAASLSGSQTVTEHDYPSYSDGSAVNNPPYCGLTYTYTSLNLNYVTAVQPIDASTCGSCLKVCGSTGCRYFLAIDKGGRGLDVSTGGAIEVFGQNTDPAPAEWEVVDPGFCEFVWSGVTGYDERANADGTAAGSAVTSSEAVNVVVTAATEGAATTTEAAVVAETTSLSTSTSSSETTTSSSSTAATALSPVVLYSNTTLLISSPTTSSMVAPWSNTTVATATVPTVAAAKTQYVATTSTLTVTVTLWELPSTTSSSSGSYVESVEGEGESPEAVTRTVYTTVWHTTEAATAAVEVTETETRTHARQFPTAVAYWNGTLTAASNGTVVNGTRY
ncbi:hypothetical protein YB2330_002913 [Saitoella coloradoensis]